jgi:uncharacterized protein with HEPN domain
MTVESLLQQMGSCPPENIAEEVRETYPDITLEDAARLRDGLTAITKARTPADRYRIQREYKALHAELRSKYRKSGS